MQNRRIGLSVPAPESDLVSIWRGLLSAAAKGGEQLTGTPPNMNDVLGISEKNDKGEDHGLNHSEDSKQQVYETGLVGGIEAGYRQGYREGFLDGYKLRNAVRRASATADKPIVRSNKAAVKIGIRLRGLPCANCGRSSYTDEQECPGCGIPKAHPVKEKAAKLR